MSVTSRPADLLEAVQKQVPEVPTEAIPTLIIQSAALQSALAARLAMLTGTDHADGPDRLLTPAAMADLMSVSVRTVYRSKGRWPFTRKLGPRTLRFSEAHYHRWLATRKA